MKQLCIHCYVSGHVQGVWYRATARKKAQSLNLTGWVRNLADGRVEVLACGLENNLQEFNEWLREGPPGANVSEVLVQDGPWQEFF